MRLMFFDDDKGVTSSIQYIITFAISAGIFTLFIIYVNPLFIATPQYIVTQNQFEDIGNGISTMIIDTYLIAPDDGKLSTSFEVPYTVAGNTYNISVMQASTTSQDREVNIVSDSKPQSVRISLNGANSTIPINGTTSSTSLYHGIIYDSDIR